MKSRRFSIPVLVVAACLAAPPTGWTQSASQVMIVTPDAIKWEDYSLVPGGQIAVLEGKMDRKGPIVARVRLPANAKVPPHWHPNTERVTVLSGMFNYGMGDTLDPEKSRPLGPGSMIVMPPKMHHFAWTSEETVLQINVDGPWGIVFVNPADDPRKK